MKRWPIIFTLCCLFLLAMLIFNVWLMREKNKLINTKISSLQEKIKPKSQPASKAFDIKRRTLQPEQVEGEREIISEKKIETLDIKEEEAKEAEALQIKPKQEETQELDKKRNLIIY